MTCGAPPFAQDLYVWGGQALSRGRTDSFTLDAPDVGKLKEVVVGLVPGEYMEEARSAWHLGSVAVLQWGSGMETQFK